MGPSEDVIRRLRPASLLPFLIWAGLLAMQLISPDRAWSWPLVGFSVMLSVSYVWARNLRDRVVAQRRTEGTWVVAGDELVEQFRLINRGWLPVLWARVRDGSAVPGYCVDRVETAPSQGERAWTTTGMCQRRGVFRLGPWELETSDPLGLFKVTQHYPATTTILVYPRASHLPNLDLPRGRAPGRAVSAERAAEETIMVGGVRQYAEGDSLRRVHWPSTARHGHWMVREFDREPSGDLWLIVDMDAAVQAGREAEATQEYAVILAASLAGQFARSGERRGVGLLISGRNPQMLPPARGQAQLWRILDALAQAEPAPGLPLAALLKQASPSLGSGRTLVVITPSADPAWVAQLLPLAARGNAPTAVLLDAATFDVLPGADSGGLLGLRGLLARQRIPSHVLAQGFPFRPVERIRRRRRELRTLPGFGRVIATDVVEEV
jgi:uncharacterized protein (DUF58 family)